MRKPAIKYTAGEIGRPKVIEDVLAPPDALVVRGNHLEKTHDVGWAKQSVPTISFKKSDIRNCAWARRFAP